MHVENNLEKTGVKKRIWSISYVRVCLAFNKDILTCFSGTCAGNVDLWLVNPCEMGRAAATVDVIGVHTQRFLQF